MTADWSKKIPTGPGRYEFRAHETHRPLEVEIDRELMAWFTEKGRALPVRDTRGEWRGPLEPKISG